MFYLDSSNPKEVEELFKWGVLSGVTTNPLIISREMPGADLETTIKNILAVSIGPVSVELVSDSFGDMVEEAKRYHTWDQRIVVKVPVNALGLKVINWLHGIGISVNATCIMTPPQALLAAKAGADYVSLFLGRIKDLGIDGKAAMGEVAKVLDTFRLPLVKIIAGSIRSYADVGEAISGGADIVTVPPKILRQLVHHPRTEETIKEFADAWKAHQENIK